MRGAPTGNHGRDGSHDDRARWKRLRAALTTQAAQKLCEALFWVAIGGLFDTVTESAGAGLRHRLAQSWFRLTLDLTKKTTGQKNPGCLLDLIPVALVQAIFRLLIDAFPPEHEKLVRSTETLLDKLTQTVQRLDFHRDGRAAFFCRSSIP